MIDTLLNVALVWIVAMLVSIVAFATARGRA